MENNRFLNNQGVKGEIKKYLETSKSGNDIPKCTDVAKAVLRGTFTGHQYRKRCRTALTVRETPIKTTTRCPLAPAREAARRVSEGWGNANLACRWGGRESAQPEGEQYDGASGNGDRSRRACDPATPLLGAHLQGTKSVP